MMLRVALAVVPVLGWGPGVGSAGVAEGFGFRGKLRFGGAEGIQGTVLEVAEDPQGERRLTLLRWQVLVHPPEADRIVGVDPQDERQVLVLQPVQVRHDGIDDARPPPAVNRGQKVRRLTGEK